MMKSIAFFCGAASGNDVKYSELAAEFGTECARRGLVLYYGGARVGLMHAAAQAALNAGGTVIGVTPTFFSKDVVQADNITELIHVASMSERKQLLEKRADSFVAIPGAFGTMDEFFELLTDAELGLHHKPVALLNAYGFYDHIISQLELFMKEGFLKKCHFDLLIIANSVGELFSKIENYNNTNDQEWLERIKN